MSKKRILFVSEASFIHSGFGKFYKELISRIHATGKYEIAEFACCGFVQDNRDFTIPWRYYANHVRKEDSRHAEFASDGLNQFGAWRFERVLLDFKPDIVYDMRDSYMFSYQGTSPLRDFYHWCIVPTVDSAPQKIDWINMFRSADSLFVYSDWAKPVLEKEGGGRIKLFGELSPGVDLQVYNQVKDKRAHKESLGLKGDSIIIGTVMRNQVRKLYPDLFASFKKTLGNLPRHLSDKTYLYCHTSYPDNGWNIPDLLLEHGIAHKALFTYVCATCKNWEVSLFKDARTACRHCMNDTLYLPNTVNGIDDTQLARVFNLFDLYIQYANCEGFGMPAVEAAACGIPVAEVDYSAMADIVRKLDGYPIKVKTLRKEIHEYAYRAVPDNDDCTNYMTRFCNLPETLRLQKGFKTRKLAEKYYNWDDKGKILERHFDSIQLKGKQGKWDTEPASIFTPTEISPSPDFTNSEFLSWCFDKVLGEPLTEANSYLYCFYLSMLNNGFVDGKSSESRLGREHVVNEILKIRQNKNHVEQVRTGVLPLSQQDYIDYANIKQGLQ